MTKITRRKFIKISAAGTATIAMSGVILDASPKIADLFDKKPAKESDVERTPTICEVCFWKCAGWVYKNKKGNVQKIIGNDLDPHSNGRMCPRGTGGVGMYNDPDRLKTPLIRVANGGEQTFREATWEEALDLVATKMKEIKDKYGAESFALFDHGSTAPHFEHLFKSYGSETSAEPAIAQCLGSRQAAYYATFGEGIPTPEPVDFVNSKAIVLIGTHIGENMHNGLVQDFSHAIENGASIIVVDPRFSTAASKAKFWLPIKPSTDMALLLAWMHILIFENLYDKKYIEKYTYGFEQLKSHVKNYTAEWAADITELDVNLIKNAIYEMARVAPAVVIHPGRHTAWYGDDTQRERATAILNGLLGAWGSKGGFYLPEQIKIPKYPMPKYPKPKWTWRDLTKKYRGAIAGVTNIIRDASLPDSKYEQKVKAWFVTATNILQSVSEREKTIKAIQNLDFLVVVDTMPADIVGYADVVLPECTYIERYDYLRTSKHKIPTVALRMPAVKPKNKTKPGWWISREIGIRMGLKKYYPWNTFEEYLDWKLKKIGTSLVEMKKVGVKRYKRQTPLYIPDGSDWYFSTNTGKIELYSTWLADLGYDAMPKYTAHEDNPSGFYRLIYGRAPMHTFGRTINNPNLNDLMDENFLWIHPKVAKIEGLTNGQEVWLKNQDGFFTKYPIKVRITERVRYDSVFMVHGFGQSNKKMKRAFAKGAGDYRLITKVALDEVTGGAAMRGNFITILTEKPQKKEVDS